MDLEEARRTLLCRRQQTVTVCLVGDEQAALAGHSEAQSKCFETTPDDKILEVLVRFILSRESIRGIILRLSFGTKPCKRAFMQN